MKALTTNNELVEIRPGTPVCGVGFRVVAITYEDTRHPEWLNEMLYTRMCPVTLPPSITGENHEPQTPRDEEDRPQTHAPVR